MRKMRDSIRLALASDCSMNSDEIADYIRKHIDSEAKVITIYLTVRMMYKEGLLVRIGNNYELKSKSSSLLD